MIKNLIILKKHIFLIIIIFNINHTNHLFSAVIKKDYNSACVIPYHWTKDGTTLILLGEEIREGKKYWFDFCGRKDEIDNTPFETALREVNEETAQQIHIMKFSGQPRSVRSRGGQGRLVTFFLPADYIEVEKIKEAAPKHKHVEKTNWKWFKAEDLLSGKLDNILWPKFIKKLKDSKTLENILEIIDLGHKR